MKREALAQDEVGAQPGRAPLGNRGLGRARSVILLYLQGAPSHIDLWDPKPDAPSSIRGEFRPIATSVPGIFLGEVLPRLARHADKFALVRTLSFNPKGLTNHGAAKFYGKAFSLLESAQAARAFRLDEEPAVIRAEYGATRFGQSCLLARRLVESGVRFVQVTWPARSDDEPAAGPDGSWDTHRNNFPMLREHRCPVFDRSAAALIADLAARGLLDETLVVAVGEFGRSPRIGEPTTMNVGPGGRDHWPHCYSALMAGGGVRGGQVHGQSDAQAAFPKSDPVHPFDLIATVYHALGIDPALHFRDLLNRPRRLVDHGNPILDLFT